MKYTVNFFKASSEWHTDEEVILPKELVKLADEANAKGYWGKSICDVRKWMTDYLTKGDTPYKGMYAVVTVPEEDDYLAYPLMIPASERM